MGRRSARSEDLPSAALFTPRPFHTQTCLYLMSHGPAFSPACLRQGEVGRGGRLLRPQRMPPTSTKPLHTANPLPVPSSRRRLLPLPTKHLGCAQSLSLCRFRSAARALTSKTAEGKGNAPSPHP
eukprot:351993-Chlamydomonas_euryale.AAC.3